MLRVTVDDDVIEDVKDYGFTGSTLLLHFADGSIRGIAGYIEFEIERVENPNAPF